VGGVATAGCYSWLYHVPTLRTKQDHMVGSCGMKNEVFAAVKISTVVLWVMIPCRLVGGCQRFGGIYCLRLQEEGCSISHKVLVTSYQTTRRHEPEDQDIVH
jgi:hypothetical protein